MHTFIVYLLGNCIFMGTIIFFHDVLFHFSFSGNGCLDLPPSPKCFLSITTLNFHEITSIRLEPNIAIKFNHKIFLFL